MLCGRLHEIEFGEVQSLCCRMLNIDASYFNILVNKLLEQIFTKVQTQVRKLLAGIFQSHAQQSCGIAIFCQVLV